MVKKIPDSCLRCGGAKQIKDSFGGIKERKRLYQPTNRNVPNLDRINRYQK